MPGRSVSLDHAPRDAFLHIYPARVPRRSALADRRWTTRCATRFGLMRPRRRLVGGTRPRGSWAGRHQAERYGLEQRPLRATRRQLDADAREVLDHARADLDQPLADGRALGL